MTIAFLAPVAAFGGTFGTTIVCGAVLVIAAFFGWICYAIAKSAGFNGWPFFILGFFTAIVGVIITTIVYYIARHKNATLRAAQREAAGPIPLGNVYSAAEDNPLLTQQWPGQPPQGQPYGQQQEAYPGAGQQPAAPPPGTNSPPAGASAPCPNCGAPVPVGVSPCPTCGTSLKWPEPGPSSGQW